MHAENLASAVKRLTQKPMEISPAYIPLMNIVLSVQRVHLIKNGEKKAYRRVLNVNEIADFDNYMNAFEWDPAKDAYEIHLEKSALLLSISTRSGLTTKDLLDEIKRRKDVLHWMREKNIRSYKEVANIIAEYYARPKQFYEKLLSGEEVKPIAASRET
jgi:flagellar protein FlaI